MFSIRSLVPAFILIVVAICPEVSSACKCAQPPPPKEAMKGAHAVFAGKVIAIKIDGFQKHVRFKVEKIWKGEMGNEVIVTTPVRGASCGYGFTQQGDGKYLVYCYLNKKTKAYMTNICTRTKTLAKAAYDMKALGVSRAPK
jgi:hypothetical protein